MSNNEADTVVILSSELISKITEEYFNKTMFKQRVTIVDLKPTENGYMFSVAFSAKQPAISQGIPTQGEYNHAIQELVKMNGSQRDSKGKFVKVGVRE